MLEEERGEREREMDELEERLEEYERGLRILEPEETEDIDRDRSRGERSRERRGYRGVLWEWIALGKEEKEIRSDLKRLGWRGN